jgi:glutaredoxin-like protein
MEDRVRELLATLERPVELLVALGPEETPLAGAARDVDFGAETEKVARWLAGLSDLVTVRVEEEPFGFDRYPAVSVQRDGRDDGVRYDGLPFGYELGSLIGAVVEAGRTTSSLSDESLARLETLERDVTIDVFVTPSCPHCPPAVLLAYRLAFASERVRATAIELTEFPALADEQQVYSVPKIVVDGAGGWEGSVPERVFVDRVLAPTYE